MSLKIVSYDLKSQNRDYTQLISAIKEEGSWWHYMESFWLLDTKKSVDDLVEKLKDLLDQEDRLLIIDLSSRDYNGWLPQTAYDWISKRIKNDVV